MNVSNDFKIKGPNKNKQDKNSAHNLRCNPIVLKDHSKIDFQTLGSDRISNSVALSTVSKEYTQKRIQLHEVSRPQSSESTNDSA